MKANEFCYWLQGHFELKEGVDNQFSPAQIECVGNHLALVEKVEGSLSGFPAWLHAAMDVQKRMESPKGTVSSGDERFWGAVQRKLAEAFVHEIDPTYGGDPAELQAIHDGKKKRPPWPHRPDTSGGGGLGSDTVFRC